MAGPIYKAWWGKLTAAWYQLSKEEQESLLAKVSEAREKAGGKLVIFCNSSWASENWQYFGVEEFPDIEAVQKHTELLNELNLMMYVDSSSVLGTEWQPPS
jgi:hypothetical protein